MDIHQSLERKYKKGICEGKESGEKDPKDDMWKIDVQKGIGKIINSSTDNKERKYSELTRDLNL